MHAPDRDVRLHRHVRRSDLQGLSRLAVDGVVGITDLVEAMHHAIAPWPAVLRSTRPDRTSGITGTVYRTVRGTTRIVGRALDVALGAFARSADERRASPARDAYIAALNGVCGDHLADTANPLAIPMALRVAGRSLVLERGALASAIPDAGGKLLVLVHGLCMNDRQWSREGHDHGLALGRDAGFTPLYLHYNSGRHVSQNGRAFAALLEQLVAQWPRPIDELVLLGHSMGGLAMRSACHYGAEAGHRWPGSLTKLVFLGTPHHGATLERGGHRVDMLFGASRYIVPFARLGKVRSAGITDLRFGNLQDADWCGRDRYEQRHDDRRPMPLPVGVRSYAVAACTAKRVDSVRARVIGDGLVPLASALGEHDDPGRNLALAPAHRRIVSSAHHWDLLSRADVYELLRGWLAPARRGARSGC